MMISLQRRRRFWPILLFAAICMAGLFLLHTCHIQNEDLSFLSSIEIPDWIDIQLITLGSDARKGRPLDSLNHIVIHYVGNPGTTAQQNRNYFNNPDTVVSAHFVIGLEGEIIQCVPLSEQAVASNQANCDSISIEVCHPDEDGMFTDKTYQSLIRLCAWLCQQCRLDEEALIRHYDVTGKACPIYYVNHPEAWEQLKNDVATYLAEL